MLRVAFVLLFGWAIAAHLKAQSLEEAAAQLAARISSLLPRRATVSLDFENLTQLPVPSPSFRNALEQELSKAGLRMAATQPDTRVRISLSEDAKGPLFVAEMISGDNRQVVMLPWNAPPQQESKPRLKITTRPVLQQAEPILDILLLNADSELLALSPSTVSSFRLMDGKWTRDGLAALNLARPPARDPRGRIELSAGGLHVYLPGSTCSGALQPVLKLACAPANEAWPLNPSDPNTTARWVSDRNLLESNLVQAAFYSSAYGWFTTADSRIIDHNGDSLDGSDSWGSDFASIANSCGADSIVFASGRGDNPDRDQVAAYQIANGHATPSSEPLILPGSVTALWTAETSGQASLVIRNSNTGNYEAFRLGLACAQ